MEYKSKVSKLGLKPGVAPLIGFLIIAIVGFVLISLIKNNIDKVDFESGINYLRVGEDPQVKSLKVLGASDKVSDIERDLNSTKLDKLDEELPQIDRDASAGL